MVPEEAAVVSAEREGRERKTTINFNRAMKKAGGRNPPRRPYY
jgi:hypothetical protein